MKICASVLQSKCLLKHISMKQIARLLRSAWSSDSDSRCVCVPVTHVTVNICPHKNPNTACKATACNRLYFGSARQHVGYSSTVSQSQQRAGNICSCGRSNFTFNSLFQRKDIHLVNSHSCPIHMFQLIFFLCYNTWDILSTLNLVAQVWKDHRLGLFLRNLQLEMQI